MADDGAKTQIMLAVSQSETDGYPNASVSSKQALDFTLKNIVRSDASRFRIFILHVYRPQHDRRKAQLKGNPLVDYFKEICREAGVENDGQVLQGDPVEVICDEVQRVMPHLLVLGSRNLSPSQRNLTTTVSDKFSTIVGCPILIVKRNRDDTSLRDN